MSLKLIQNCNCAVLWESVRVGGGDGVDKELQEAFLEEVTKLRFKNWVGIHQTKWGWRGYWDEKTTVQRPWWAGVWWIWKPLGEGKQAGGRMVESREKGSLGGHFRQDHEGTQAVTKSFTLVLVKVERI